MYVNSSNEPIHYNELDHATYSMREWTLFFILFFYEELVHSE